MFKQLKLINFKTLILNFGPQHPAAHGVLRLIIQIRGEILISADSHIGLLHRGTEKLIETKTYIQNLPYFDRLDYVSMMAYEHTYILALEKLLNLYIVPKDSYIRMILLELTRILNHLLCIGCQAMDLGAVTPYFLGFEEREKIFEFYERLSGARMHAAFFRPGGLSFNLPYGFLNDLDLFIQQFESRIFELKELLDNNRIWKDRLINVGSVSLIDAQKLGLNGVMLRGSGISYDVRTEEPYELYSNVKFGIPVGVSGHGDCFDRYHVRMFEMLESISIIKQCLVVVNMVKNDEVNSSGFVNLFNKRTDQIQDPSKFLKSKTDLKFSMEALIDHFKLISEGICVPSGVSKIFTEAPKGELGVFLYSDGTSKPYRCKIKAPGFNHLQSISELCKGHLIADLVTIIGSLDIVFGEIDR